MPITRRTFLEGSIATVGLAATTDALAGSKPDLVDVHGKDPKKMVAAALEGLGGMKKIVHRGDFVVIKPNAAFANPPEWGTTTHPDTVVAVAEACFKAGAKRVMVVEFPQAKGMKCLKRCGIADALKAVPKAKLKLLDDPKDFKKVKVKGGVSLKEVDVAKVVLSSDVLINLPAAKHHTNTGVSLGIKNAMGLIYDRRVFHTRLDLNQAIADLALVIKPNLTILDASRALLTNGPTGPGETAQPGRIVAGLNPVSVDAYGLTLARFNNRNMKPKEVRHIELAGAAGLGEVNISKLKVKTIKT